MSAGAPEEAEVSPEQSISDEEVPGMAGPEVPEETEVGLEQIGSNEKMQDTSVVEAESDAEANGIVTRAVGAAPRFAVALVGLASIFVIIFGIQASAYILNPILLAGMITIALVPVPGKLKKRGLPGWASVLLTILAVVGVLALVLLFVLFSLGQLQATIPTYGEDTEASQQQLPKALSGLEFGSVLSDEQFEEIAGAILSIIGTATVQLFMALFIFAFMLSATLSLPSAQRMGMDPAGPAIQRLTGFTEDVRHYLSTMTVINLLVGLGDTIFLLIMGVDFALLWGILAWFLGYIPSIGFWLALIPPVILAWGESGTTTALIVFLGYVLINGSVQNIVQPRMMGDRLHITPVVVFVSLFIWGWLLGGIGAILAVPLTLMVLAVLDSFDATRWLVVLVRFTPEHSEDERQEAQSRLSGIWGSIRKRTGLGKKVPEAGA